MAAANQAVRFLQNSADGSSRCLLGLFDSLANPCERFPEVQRCYGLAEPVAKPLAIVALLRRQGQSIPAQFEGDQSPNAAVRRISPQHRGQDGFAARLLIVG